MIRSGGELVFHDAAGAHHPLRPLGGRRARAGRSGGLCLVRADHPSRPAREQPALAEPRNWSAHRRCRHVRHLHLYRPPGEPVLADMGECPSRDRLAWPSGAVRDAGHLLAGLCEGAGDVELSDPRTDGAGHLSPPAAAEPLRCRQILDELLRPIGPGAAGWADRLVSEFGSLGAVLAAPPAAQQRVIGNERKVLAWLATLRSAMLHALRREALQGPVLGDSRAVMDYLFAAMAHEPVEQLRVLYLNTRNCLLFDETVVEGSINIAPIYPREIVRRSLEVGATALILAHNHPSGDPRPSSEDI